MKCIYIYIYISGLKINLTKKIQSQINVYKNAFQINIQIIWHLFILNIIQILFIEYMCAHTHTHNILHILTYMHTLVYIYYYFNVLIHKLLNSGNELSKHFYL